MTQYAGNAASFPVDFTIVADNTDRTAVSVNVATEALGDRTAWLKAHIMDGLVGGTYAPSSPLNISNLGTLSGSGPMTLTGDFGCDDIQADSIACNTLIVTDGLGGIGHELGPTYFRSNTNITLKGTSSLVPDSPRSKTIVIQSPFYSGFTNQFWGTTPAVTTVNPNWYHAGPAINLQQIANTRTFCKLGGLPPTFTITLVRLWCRGATGHGTLPISADRFQFVVSRVHKLTGASSAVTASVADPSGTILAYETYHSITSAAISHVYDPATYQYYVDVTGEKGANFVAQGEVYVVEVIGTYSKIGE